MAREIFFSPTEGHCENSIHEVNAALSINNIECGQYCLATEIYNDHIGNVACGSESLRANPLIICESYEYIVSRVVFSKVLACSQYLQSCDRETENNRIFICFTSSKECLTWIDVLFMTKMIPNTILFGWSREINLSTYDSRFGRSCVLLALLLFIFHNDWRIINSLYVACAVSGPNRVPTLGFTFSGTFAHSTSAGHMQCHGRVVSYCPTENI